MRFSSLTLSGYIGSSTRSERDGKIPSLHKKAKIKSSVSIQPFNLKDKEVKVMIPDLLGFAKTAMKFLGVDYLSVDDFGGCEADCVHFTRPFHWVLRFELF